MHRHKERFLELIQACLETASFVLELQQCVTFRIVQAGADDLGSALWNRYLVPSMVGFSQPVV